MKKAKKAARPAKAAKTTKAVSRGSSPDGQLHITKLTILFAGTATLIFLSALSFTMGR